MDENAPMIPRGRSTEGAVCGGGHCAAMEDLWLRIIEREIDLG